MIDSMADAMEAISMMHSTRTGLFYEGIDCIFVLYFGPRKKYPPALLRDSGSEM